MAGEPHWGVDSWTRADTPHGSTTLYDYVVKHTKRRPKFWGRYVGGNDQNPFKNQNGFLTTEEIKFLRERVDRILCIYTGLKNSVGLGAEQGKKDAAEACRVAQEVLGIDPARDGTWIYADIEPDYTKVASAWIQGWMEQMYTSPFRGGFYAPTGNPVGFNKVYCAALKALGEGTPPRVPDIRVRTNLYALSPLPGCDATRTTFAPDKPDCHPDGVVIWQYAGHCLQIPKVWEVDMDLATDRGFLSMWNPVQKHVEPTHRTREKMNVEDAGDPAATASDASFGKGRAADDQVFTEVDP
jgi:hypothetical protein